LVALLALRAYEPDDVEDEEDVGCPSQP